MFIVRNLLLGVGLAMDAFSVSLADGLSGSCGRRRDACRVALVFALFQGMMPLLGWLLVHTVTQTFSILRPFIPWVALLLLSFIGIKMIVEGARGCDAAQQTEERMTLRLLAVQGVATSIDALSVGFTIADYTAPMALCAAALIGAVTFCICYVGVRLGRRMGTCLAGRAGIFGGALLVLIGLEILITSLI